MKSKKIYSYSIFKQLVSFTIVISVVPIILISGFLFQKIERLIVGDLVNSHEQITAQYMKNIEEKMLQYQNSLEFIANNTIILDTLTNSSGKSSPYMKGRDISTEVTKSLLLDRPSEIRNCMIYSKIGENPVYGSRATMMEEAKKETWYRNKKALNEGWFTYISAGKGQTILSILREIEKIDLLNYTKKDIGIIKLDIYMERLFSPGKNWDNEKSNFDVIVYGADGQDLYDSDPDKREVLTEFLQRQSDGEDYHNGKIHTISDYVVAGTALEEYGMNILFLFTNSELMEKKGEIQLLVIPLLLLVILAILFFSYLFTYRFSARVGALVQKIKVAETGDLTITKPIAGSDEIAYLDKQFSHMLKKLDKLIRKNYIQQLENKETQLRNLQLQINPHFLYNTLETISSIAAVNQAFVVCDMCEKLGEIFRYSLGKNYGEFVTISQELHHTQNYIFIQKIRYNERFEVFYNVEADVDRYMILRFILQPIVENAIVHGLGNLTSKGTLEISIRREKDALLIVIEDDGVGMDAERVRDLNAFINEPKEVRDNKKSIGIRNVNQRIQLSCGNEYGIFIESMPYQGSRFYIRLPLIQRGGDM
ncbi:histidine kinase [uncultured Robinsoniella sp.]|uniref:sensor histidine kinase n=1 Tax=uncultured Robinsoniella sp. TaxID=904190 RepID=UPI00374FD226